MKSEKSDLFLFSDSKTSIKELIRCINLLNEYAVLDRKLDTSYPMEVDTPYLFIDQNNGLELVRYGLEYGVLPSSGYNILDLVSLVFGECRHRYGISSLIDTAYWFSEQ
ncbi:hypothetical protein Tco_0743034 [Tanacetum coccineum]